MPKYCLVIMEAGADHMGLATDKAFTKLMEPGGHY